MLIAHESLASFLHVARKHVSRLSFEIQLARNNKKLTIDRFELKSVDWPFQIHKNSPSLKRTNYLQKMKQFLKNCTFNQKGKKIEIRFIDEHRRRGFIPPFSTVLRRSDGFSEWLRNPANGDLTV